MTMSVIPDTMSNLAQQLDTLRRKTRETAEDLRKMELDQQSFALLYNEITKLNEGLQQIQAEGRKPLNVQLEKMLKRRKDRNSYAKQYGQVEGTSNPHQPYPKTFNQGGGIFLRTRMVPISGVHWIGRLVKTRGAKALGLPEGINQLVLMIYE